MKTVELIHKACRKLPVGRLLLCVSGGADSMTLLHGCVRVGRKCIVVHCDFHLRGLESERDREFVEATCAKLGVHCIVEHFDVPAYQQQHGVSLEMACRDLRYASFRRLAAEHGCVRIVLAHNRDDNDETMLLNLFRGTGVRGLCGMSADTGELARPLLGVSRAQIEEYMRSGNHPFITDSSNLTSDFKRNFIRRELMPLIATRWPGVYKALERTRRNMQECEVVCEASIQQSLSGRADYLSAEAYMQTPSRSMLLKRWLTGREVSPAQLDEMAAGLRPGCCWNLGTDMVEMQRDGLHIYPLSPDAYLPEMQVEIVPYTDDIKHKIHSNRDETVLYCPVQAPLQLRMARTGDRISPFGMRGSKLVSDLLRESGIMRGQRKGYPLVVDEQDRVIWIPRVRRSLHYAVSEKKDKHIKVITLKNIADI